MDVDSYGDHRHEFGLEAEPAPTPAAPAEPQPAGGIGTDERRMHVRAYNYWCSLLDGRDYPSIQDLDATGVSDFGPHSVLLDFSGGGEDPACAFVGDAIRAECEIGEGAQRISNVPARSLLSRLTDHYMQIIANRAPVGFEAEFINQRGHEISYRGIMMPFSSDGETIDFIYGVINWKDGGGGAVPFAPPAPAIEALAPAPFAFADEPEQDGTEEGGAPDEEDAAPTLDADAGLADRLWAARESAEICKAADGRSRLALYRALAMAYDFSVAAKRVPEDYAEILDDAGVKAQARAPMTPIVKLVFGADYDKTRLTEFAAALSYAERTNVDFGGFQALVEKADGGLKGLVAAERKARRPEAPNDQDRLETGKAALRGAPPLALAQLATNEEFALVITRRNADGVHEPVTLVADSALLERLIRKLG